VDALSFNVDRHRAGCVRKFPPLSG
jgi:hypothetical protein